MVNVNSRMGWCFLETADCGTDLIVGHHSLSMNPPAEVLLIEALAGDGDAVVAALAAALVEAVDREEVGGGQCSPTWGRSTDTLLAQVPCLEGPKCNSISHMDETTARSLATLDKLKEQSTLHTFTPEALAHCTQALFSCGMATLERSE